MSFVPVLPAGGYAGWRFLQQTLPAQTEAFGQSPGITRLATHFRDRIGAVETAADLVADRQLREVALGAFGLDDDIDNTFFVQAILDGGTTNPDALANRLSDSRYGQLTRAMGFGEGLPPRTKLSSFAGEILARYEARQFERAVGEQDPDMRLALNFEPALNDILQGTTSPDARWFQMMGNAPLRSLFETALGFPSSFGSIDLDQQLTQFKARTEATFGTDDLAALTEPEAAEKMVRLFLVRAEAAAIGTDSTGARTALTLLQSIPR